MRVHSHHLHIVKGMAVRCDGVGGEAEERARQALAARETARSKPPEPVN